MILIKPKYSSMTSITVLNKARVLRLWLALTVFVVWPGLAHAQNPPRPLPVGESISYTIKKFGVKVGEATLAFGGLEKIEGREFYRITFVAKAPNFFDEEKIFIDPQTFYPRLVQRNLNIFGKKERITEHYDAASGDIKIVKEAGGKISEQVIAGKKNADNIYCFLYRFRGQGKADKGLKFTMQLPTKNVQLEVKDKSKVKVAGRTYEAVYLESDPKEYKIWFEAGPRLVPLRIDGAMGIVNTSLVLSEYHP